MTRSKGACCAISSACLLKGVLDEAFGMFMAVLDRYTLADLVTPRHRLSALLGVATGR